MRFGLTVPNFGDYFDPRLLASLARDAERAGWDGFFVWDHTVAWPTPIVDPWVALSAIAIATERIRIGPLVTPLPRRRPTKLAREVVSLDHLSNGRVILGVGIGTGPWEWDYLGEETDLRTRGAMLDEGLELLAKLWSGDEPFDVVVCGHTSADDATVVHAYDDAGATWWLEDISPWAFGWQWNGPWPIEQMNDRVHAGPPRRAATTNRG